MTNTLTILGLFLNLVGVILLFRYALPFATRRDDRQYIVAGPDPEGQERVRVYEVRSRFGIAFVMLGRLLQIAPLIGIFG
jgi:hypothetical protein